MDALNEILNRASDIITWLSWSGCIGVAAFVIGMSATGKSKRLRRDANLPGKWKNMDEGAAGFAKTAGLFWFVVGTGLLALRFFPHQIAQLFEFAISKIT